MAPTKHNQRGLSLGYTNPTRLQELNSQTDWSVLLITEKFCGNFRPYRLQDEREAIFSGRDYIG